MPMRAVVISLASDFGCQVQMTNMEDHLLDLLGLVDITYWQLASSGHLPESYDVAIVEGSATTVDHVELLKDVRHKASAVIAIGACAVTGGIPLLAAEGGLERRLVEVYGESWRTVASGHISPLAVGDVISVDYHVPGCPIDPEEFVSVLHRALMGLSDRPPREPMCAACKTAENECLLDKGLPCIGMVARNGCGARCVSLGRPCLACRGIADDANVPAAEQMLLKRGFTSRQFAAAMAIYNSRSEAAR